MKKSTFNTLLVGGGFLLGTAGIKLLTSAPVKNACVQGIACGMRVKNCYQDMVEQAKANVDDMVAEAAYITRARPLLTRQPSNAPGTNYEILDY